MMSINKHQIEPSKAWETFYKPLDILHDWLRLPIVMFGLEVSKKDSPILDCILGPSIEA